jgi:hypothetical protein
MRFAIVNGQLYNEAQPKTRGLCRNCGAEVIAKCGQMVVWHWAHKSKVQCDQWWESETEWHRNWKSRFPVDWQEVILHSQITGERHIADVRTPYGLVVEFQRSTIDPTEVAARQNFYQTMIWVIDGCRNELDKDHFRLGIGKLNQDGLTGFRWYGKGKLFARWHTTKPVFIDFGDGGFWRICRYDTATKEGIVGIVGIQAFVDMVSSGTTDFSSIGGPASK